MKLGGSLPPMPFNPAPIVIERLMEVGLFEANGMGITPISWPTIDAWCRCTRLDLSPWAVRLLRRLSADYVAESRRADDETAPSPWRAPVMKSEADLEEARLLAVLDA